MRQPGYDTFGPQQPHEYDNEPSIDQLKAENRLLRHAAKLISRRRFMDSGGPEMASCDEYCKRLDLRPWDMDWTMGRV